MKQKQSTIQDYFRPTTVTENKSTVAENQKRKTKKQSVAKSAKPTIERSTGLIDLPDDLWKVLLSDWLPTFKDILALDTALCSNAHRLRWLKSLLHTGLSISIGSPQDRLGLLYSKLLPWLYLKKRIFAKEFHLNLASFRELATLCDIPLVGFSDGSTCSTVTSASNKNGDLDGSNIASDDNNDDYDYDDDNGDDGEGTGSDTEDQVEEEEPWQLFECEDDITDVQFQTLGAVFDQIQTLWLSLDFDFYTKQELSEDEELDELEITHTLLRFLYKHNFIFPKVQTLHLIVLVDCSQYWRIVQDFISTKRFPVLTTLHLHQDRRADFLYASIMFGDFSDVAMSQISSFHPEGIEEGDRREAIANNFWKLPCSIQTLVIDILELQPNRTEVEFLCFLQHNHDTQLQHIDIYRDKSEFRSPSVLQLFQKAYPGPMPAIKTIIIGGGNGLPLILSRLFASSLQKLHANEYNSTLVDQWNELRNTPNVFPVLKTLYLLPDEGFPTQDTTGMESYGQKYVSFVTSPHFSVLQDLTIHSTFLSLFILNTVSTIRSGRYGGFFIHKEDLNVNRKAACTFSALRKLTLHCSKYCCPEVNSMLSMVSLQLTRPFPFPDLQELLFREYPLCWKDWLKLWSDVALHRNLVTVHLNLVILNAERFTGFQSMMESVQSAATTQTQISNPHLQELTLKFTLEMELYYTSMEPHSYAARDESARVIHRESATQFLRCMSSFYPNLHTVCLSNISALSGSSVQYFYESLPHLHTLDITKAKLDSIPFGHRMTSENSVSADLLVPSSSLDGNAENCLLALQKKELMKPSRQFKLLRLEKICVDVAELESVLDLFSAFVDSLEHSRKIVVHMQVISSSSYCESHSLVLSKFHSSCKDIQKKYNSQPQHRYCPMEFDVYPFVIST